MKILSRYLVLLILVSTSIHPLLAQWMQTNGPYADNIRAFLFTNSVSLAGSYQNGIYRSTDEGKHWVSTSYNYGASITCFNMLHDTIFAGTNGQDVYRSVDKGFNWTRMTNGYFGNENVRSLAVSRGNLFAGTYGHGVFVSKDRINFVPTKGTLPNLYISSLLSIDSMLIVGTNGAGIFRSSDSGNNWFQSNTGLSDSIITCLLQGNAFILVGTNSGVFRSTNNGESWSKASNGLPMARINALSTLDGQLFAATNANGIFRSTDNSENWLQAGLGDKSIASLATSGSTLFAGDAYDFGGMFSSTDSGRTWSQQNNGIHKATVKTITSHNSVLYAGSESAGIFRSNNGGKEWIQINSGLQTLDVYALAVKENYIYAGTRSGLFRSTDGTEWSFVSPDGYYDGIYSICTKDSALFIGTGTVNCNIYRSYDSGDQWTKVFTGFGGTFNALCVNDTSLFAGALYSFNRSTNFGNNWSTISGNIQPLSLFANDEIIFAGGNGTGVFRSSDNGISWTPVNSGLTKKTVYTLAGTNEVIYAGTFSGGVFKSTNHGDEWINDGLSQNSVYALHINDTLLYSGLYLNGVWVRRLPVTISKATEKPGDTAPTTFQLIQNYPNPFNPNTTISYQLPTRSHITLKVFDLLGREVVTLVKDIQELGFKSVTFDARNLSSGVYYYCMRAGNFIQTKKLLLVR